MLREFVLSDCFNSIVGVIGKYVAGNRGLCIFLKEFGVLDRFELIAGGSSGGVTGRGRELFCLSSKSLSS